MNIEKNTNNTTSTTHFYLSSEKGPQHRMESQRNACFDTTSSTDARARFAIPTCRSVQPLTPGIVDLSARRCISDSAVSKCRGSTSVYDNKNTAYMMINRSGGSTVKKIIRSISEKCDQAETSKCENNRIPSPEKEIFILAQWAVDSYYKVVIRSNNGVATIVRAMRAFESYREVQECSCLALGNLCCSANAGMVPPSRYSAVNNVNINQHSSAICPASLKAVQEANGVHQIVSAMKRFPKSVAVQSAACDALRNMSGLILSEIGVSSSAPESQACCISSEYVACFSSDLIEVLSHAKAMILHPNHRVIVENLLQTVLTAR